MLALVDTCHATLAARGRLCACLEPTALGRLRAVAVDARLPMGAVLFAEGDRAEAFYGLRQGAAMLTRNASGGRRQVLSFLFPGDTFGFAAGSVHASSAISLQRSSFCRIPLAALDADPQLATRFQHIARAWLADAFDQTLRLGRMTARERVADFLFRLWTRLGRPGELSMPMRHVDIADHLGLRLETVSREMSSLRHLGLIGRLSSDGILPMLEPFALPDLSGRLPSG